MTHRVGMAKGGQGLAPSIYRRVQREMCDGYDVLCGAVALLGQWVGCLIG